MADTDTEAPAVETCENETTGMCWCARPLGHDGEHRCSCGYEWPIDATPAGR